MLGVHLLVCGWELGLENYAQFAQVIATNFVNKQATTLQLTLFM